MLGPVGTVSGFDTFWSAARAVVPSLVDIDGYPHHSCGDRSAFVGIVSECGWHVDDVQPLISERRCGATELWRWLWGSLPLRFEDATHLEGTTRAEFEEEIRDEFFRRAEDWRDGETYVVRSAATMVCASARPVP